MDELDTLYNVHGISHAPAAADSAAATSEIPVITAADVAPQPARQLPVGKIAVALLILVGAGYVFLGGKSTTTTSSPAAAQANGPAAQRQVVASELERALVDWLNQPAEWRTFEGTKLPDGWQSVALRDRLVVGVNLGGTCVMGDVNGTAFGNPVSVGLDATGQACDPAYMADLAARSSQG